MLLNNAFLRINFVFCKLVLSVVAFLSLPACSLFLGYNKEPKVEIKEVVVRSSNISEMVLGFILEIENPNSRPIKAQRVTYKIVVNDQQLIDDVLENGFEVPAGEKAKVELQARMKFRDILKSIVGFIDQGLLRYQVDLTASVGAFTIPYSKKGEFSPNASK